MSDKMTLIGRMKICVQHPTATTNKVNWNLMRIINRNTAEMDVQSCVKTHMFDI